jgi:hypothetical protein
MMVCFVAHATRPVWPGHPARFEKLPQWLFEESRRFKVITALERAAKDFGDPAAG